MSFVPIDPMNVSTNLKFAALPVPEVRGSQKISAPAVGLQTPNLGEEEAVRGLGWYRSKEC